MARKTSGIEIARDWNDYEFGPSRLSVNVPHHVGAKEQTVLLTIMAMAGIDSSERDDGCIVVTTTMRELILACGLTSYGEAFADLERSLDRMSAITYRLAAKGADGRLAKGDRSRRERKPLMEVTDVGGRLRIKLSERLSRVFLGIEKTDENDDITHLRQYAKVRLDERLVLDGDVTKLVHAYLSCRVSKRSAIVSLNWDTMLEAVYGSKFPDASSKARHAKLKYVKAAIAQIAKKVGYLHTGKHTDAQYPHLAHWKFGYTREGINVARVGG